MKEIERLKNEYEDNIVCPYCGYIEPESYDFNEDENFYECPECGRVSRLEVQTETHYSTYADCKAEDKEHKWIEGNRYGEPSLARVGNKVLCVCRNCGRESYVEKKDVTKQEEE